MLLLRQLNVKVSKKQTVGREFHPRFLFFNGIKEPPPPWVCQLAEDQEGEVEWDGSHQGVYYHLGNLTESLFFPGLLSF